MIARPLHAVQAWATGLSPLAASVGARLAVAGLAAALLWLGVFWALLPS